MHGVAPKKFDRYVNRYGSIDNSYSRHTRVCSESKYEYGHNGQMKSNEIAGVGNHYTAKYWEMDPRVGRRWNQDPKPNESVSNYATFNNNSIWFSDHLGDTSTDVIKTPENNYKVVGGKADGDKNIYVVDESKRRTGIVIGQSLTEHSFLDDQGNDVTGAIINPFDNSGANFLNTEIIGQDIGLVEYMSNATGGKTYDFKTRDMPVGLSRRAADIYKYRGVPFNGVKGFKGSITTFASGRDIGNVGAGYMAGIKGLSWAVARLGFDALESKLEKADEIITGMFALIGILYLVYSPVLLVAVKELLSKSHKPTFKNISAC